MIAWILGFGWIVSLVATHEWGWRLAAGRRDERIIRLARERDATQADLELCRQVFRTAMRERNEAWKERDGLREANEKFRGLIYRYTAALGKCQAAVEESRK